MSYKIKVIIPVPVNADGIKAREAQLPDDFLPDNFSVVFESVKSGAALGDSYHDTLFDGCHRCRGGSHR